MLSATQVACIHCGRQVSDGSPFCCAGCRAVHGFLNSTGLGQYYKLRGPEKDSFNQQGGGATVDYRYLDDDGFLQKYARKVDQGRQIDFYVEGAHCAACIWLVEKLPSMVEDVVAARLDLGTSVATVTIKGDGSFARTAERLSWLGYRPHAIESDAHAAELQCAENRDWLKRIGVAGACSGNIMLLAGALYAGLGGALADGFRYLNALFFAPVFFYSAAPFYRNAWNSLKTRALSIDVPIVLAIVLGAVVSLYNLRDPNAHIYFDSIAALVFLLLASRYTLRRAQQKNLGGSHLFHFLQPGRARRLDIKAAAFVDVSASALLPGDLIEIAMGEVIPADGKIQLGVSAVNASLLTGESLPQRVSPGDDVYSGTVNEGARIEVKVSATGMSTRLGQILKSVEDGALRKAPIVLAADRVSKWFLAAVMLAALGVFTYGVVTGGGVADGISRALALVIVTCPCALALATPLAMSLALKRAARAGILINGAESVERITRVKSVVLDKTGTITEGRFDVLTYNALPEAAGVDLPATIVALERNSKHPIARALVRHFQDEVAGALPRLTGSREEVGVGVSGVIDGAFYEIRALRESDGVLNLPNGTRVGVYRDGAPIAVAVLGDRVRADSAVVIAALKKEKLTPYLLSGDSPEVVESVGQEVGIESANLRSLVSPEGKGAFVTMRAPCLMVGDGANDAVALRAAEVGVAVHGSMDVSLRAADVYVARPGLKPIANLLLVGRETMRVIRRNFVFSVCYNIAGGVLAATGHMTPLLAALLMPMSAFTVYSSTLLGTSKLRKGLK